MSQRALGQQWYQRPLPGMEQLGADPKLPVEQVFKHPEIAKHPGEYSITMNLNSKTRRVRTDALRPTQPHVEEGYLYRDNRSDGPVGAIQDGSGRYRLVDGHHRVARALLKGDRHMDVEVWKG